MPQLPPGLEAAAALYVILSIAASAIVIIDLSMFAPAQKMAIMKVVWPLTALYWGPIGLPFYFSIGREQPEHGHCDSEAPMWRATFKGAAHCGAGCALGDFAAEWIAFAVGFAILGSQLLGRFALSFALAYLIGIAFQYMAIEPMRNLGLRAGLAAAIKADTLSLLAYEVGMFAWMGFRAWAWPELTPLNWSYWLMMQVAMLIGFATTYPVNWTLIRAGVKERM